MDTTLCRRRRRVLLHWAQPEDVPADSSASRSALASPAAARGGRWRRASAAGSAAPLSWRPAPWAEEHVGVAVGVGARLLQVPSAAQSCRLSPMMGFIMGCTCFKGTSLNQLFQGSWWSTSARPLLCLSSFPRLWLLLFFCCALAVGRVVLWACFLLLCFWWLERGGVVFRDV